LKRRRFLRIWIQVVSDMPFPLPLFCLFYDTAGNRNTLGETINDFPQRILFFRRAFQKFKTHPEAVGTLLRIGHLRPDPQVVDGNQHLGTGLFRFDGKTADTCGGKIEECLFFILIHV
jgi:hypothetical protein